MRDCRTEEGLSGTRRRRISIFEGDIYSGGGFGLLDCWCLGGWNGIENCGSRFGLYFKMTTFDVH